MKKLSLILLMIGGFFVLVSIALNSYIINQDKKQKRSDSLAKARAAKAAKRKQEQEEVEEEIKQVLHATEKITDGQD